MARLEYYVKIGILSVVAVATIYFFIRVRAVLFPFFLGAALAYVLYPLIRVAQSRGLSRGWAVMTFYLLLVGLLGLLCWYTLPRLMREVAELAAVMPKYMEDAHQAVEYLERLEVGGGVEQVIRDSLHRAENQAYRALTTFIGDILNLTGSLLSIVFAPILAYYFIRDWEKIREGFLGLFPVRSRSQLFKLGMDINEVLSGFIQGHLLVCVLVGVLTGLAAALLGIKYAIIIGFINGIAELLPYLGPLLGAIPSLALALTEGTREAVYLGVAILVVQQLEANLLSPRIVGNRVGLHPLVVIFALLAGGELFGIWGILLAVPVAAVLRVLIRFAFYHLVD
ncbi:MAG: AI-2E family transporter [Syntrophomonadaceae bacterium]|nr:AI-2E family transporter [Syntrophomonadaceae bacterium]